MIANARCRKGRRLEKIETSAALHAHSMACHDAAITWSRGRGQVDSRCRDNLAMSGSDTASGTIDGESPIAVKCFRFASALKTKRVTAAQHATATITPAITSTT